MSRRESDTPLDEAWADGAQAAVFSIAVAAILIGFGVFFGWLIWGWT